MQKLLNSILRNRTLLLFILLLALSLRFIARNQNYQRSNFLAINNATIAPFFEVRHQFFSYFKRGQHNQQLLEDNQYLLEKRRIFTIQACILPVVALCCEALTKDCLKKQNSPFLLQKIRFALSFEEQALCSKILNDISLF